MKPRKIIKFWGSVTLRCLILVDYDTNGPSTKIILAKFDLADKLNNSIQRQKCWCYREKKY